MLDPTYTLGTTPNNLVFSRRGGDEDSSAYSVQGLTPSTARTMSVAHQSTKNGGTRSVISLDEVDVNPGSPQGNTETTRVYIVIQRPSFKTAAQLKGTVDRIKSIVSNTTLVDALLNAEA
jgi:hypothetical protein